MITVDEQTLSRAGVPDSKSFNTYICGCIDICRYIINISVFANDEANYDR